MNANQGERKIQKWKLRSDDKQTLEWVTGESALWSQHRVHVSIHSLSPGLITWTLSGVIKISAWCRRICMGSLMMSGEGTVFIHGWSWLLSDSSLEIKMLGLRDVNPPAGTWQTLEPAITKLIISIINNPSISLLCPTWPHAFISS